MIDRVSLKNRAKKGLSGYYWIAVAVCVIVSAITQLISNFYVNYNTMGNVNQTEELIGIPIEMLTSPAVVIASLMFMVLGIVCAIFFVSPLNAGKRRFFIKAIEGDAKITSVFELFKGEYYMKAVKTLFMRDLFLFLWGFFYIIPLSIIVAIGVVYEPFFYLLPISFLGIIPYLMKFYSYMMVDYIVGENPLVDWRDAINKSKEMMSQIRFQTFVLGLSFFGWVLLGAMLFGVGTIFVTPYIEATYTELYFERKNNY